MKYPVAVVGFIVVGVLLFMTFATAKQPDCSGPSDTIEFRLKLIYPDDEAWTEMTDYSKKDEKLFGKTIAQLISAIDRSYIIYSKSDSDYKPYVAKPAIYNALSKLRLHYKILIKENLTDTMTLQTELKIFLIKGYLCFSEDTELLESQLGNADSVDEIKKLLNQIELIN